MTTIELPRDPLTATGLVSELTGGVKTRAQVLRAVAEDGDLFNAESNRAFVLMQYFGYLRRNPTIRRTRITRASISG
jgi:hypothetical protein